jgi:hypothetical protein
MKYLIGFILSFSLVAQAAGPVYRIRMQDVVKKVSSENLEVYQNALKVYQAKKHISYSRAALLPKLNIWRILSTPFDPKSLLGIVSDIAPFLIPSNWFQVKIDKQLYYAQQEAYRALWANEVMTAKALYVHLLYDQNLLSHIESSKGELKKLSGIVKSHEILGGAPQGASREVEIRLLALEEDTRSLQILIEEEMSLLAYMLGFGATANLQLEPIAAPDFGRLVELSYESFELRVLAVAPELRQFEYLVNASKYVKKKVYFSMFGVTNESRGVAGGIFDNVPIQDGLGFGTPYSVQISKAETEILKLQKQGAAETLKRQLRLMIATYNLDLQNYSGLVRRTQLTAAANNQLYTRMRLGEDVEMFDLIEASRNHIQADSAMFSAQYRFLINQDKLARLLFIGDYANVPAPRSLPKQ